MLKSYPSYRFHLQHAPENSNSQSGGLRYFDALESLDDTASFFLIRHLLGFIDSPCLKSIDISFIEREPEDILTPSMMIVSSKWSQCLKNLSITFSPSSVANGITHRNLTLLTDLHEIQTFRLDDGRIENNNDAVKCLAMSWPKLQTLDLNSCHPLSHTPVVDLINSHF